MKCSSERPRVSEKEDQEQRASHDEQERDGNRGWDSVRGKWNRDKRRRERERETEEERRWVKMRGRETKRAKRNCLSEKRRETVEDPTQGLWWPEFRSASVDKREQQRTAFLSHAAQFSATTAFSPYTLASADLFLFGLLCTLLCPLHHSRCRIGCIFHFLRGCSDSRPPQTGCVMPLSLYLAQSFLTPFRVCITRLILFVFMEVSRYNACWWYTWPSPFVAVRTASTMRTRRWGRARLYGCINREHIHVDLLMWKWMLHAYLLSSRLAFINWREWIARCFTTALRSSFIKNISGIVRQSRSNLWVF